MDKERKKWRNIVHIIIAVILFLSKQNLSFRGQCGEFDSKKQGNFLETVKLIAKALVLAKQWTCTKQWFHVQSNVTALGVLQWLTERRLRDSTLHLCLCL